jgi:hypothetical protein
MGIATTRIVIPVHLRTETTPRRTLIAQRKARHRETERSFFEEITSFHSASFDTFDEY